MDSAVIDRQTSFDNLPELLSPAEVSNFLGFEKKTVYRLINRGEIPARLIGKRLFVSKAVLMGGTPEAVGA